MQTGSIISWLSCAVLTIFLWGCYGVFLHKGQIAMAEPTHGRYKAFLVVGVAYLVIAVFGSLFMIFSKGGSLSFTSSGFLWSFLAGAVGALGAFFILVSFGNGGTPSVVMALIFGGAPLINAFIAIGSQKAQGKITLSQLPWQFYVGFLMIALGAFLVTYFKPK